MNMSLHIGNHQDGIGKELASPKGGWLVNCGAWNRHGPLIKGTSLLIGSLLLLSVLAGTSFAAGNDPNGGGPDGTGDGKDGDGQQAPQNRKVDVDVEPHRVEVKATLREAEQADEIGYRFEATNWLRIELEYKNQMESKNATIRLAVSFRQILEFEDIDGDGGFGPFDEVVSTYDLGGAEYGNIHYQERNTMDNQKVHIVTARTMNGTFTVVTHLSGTQAKIGSGTLSPDFAKLDFIIDGFPYLRQNTRLALRTMLETQAQIAIMQNSSDRAYLGENEGGVEAQMRETTAFYSWVRTASVDGMDKSVKVTTTTDAEGTCLYFSYARGENITHDPKLGLSLDYDLQVDDFDIMSKIIPYVLAMATGAVVIAATVGWRRKKNGMM